MPTSPSCKNYLNLDQFEPANLWGSFGSQVISKRKTAPKHSFGTSTRNQFSKVYQSKEMAKTMFIGKASQGPKYTVTDKFTYSNDPEWKFGSDPRSTLTTAPKFDHYLRKDLDFDPISADKQKRPRCQTAKIGLEPRFINSPQRNQAILTPGPKYNPSLKHEIQNSSKYTFGFRRYIKGQCNLKPETSTPDNVGPGLYLKQQVVNISNQRKSPQFSMPKAIRQGLENRAFDKHQTYDYKQKAIGVQVNSKKKTMPAINIGKGRRNNPSGIFKQHMTNPVSSIRISIPKF